MSTTLNINTLKIKEHTKSSTQIYIITLANVPITFKQEPICFLFYWSVEQNTERMPNDFMVVHSSKFRPQPVYNGGPWLLMLPNKPVLFKLMFFLEISMAFAVNWFYLKSTL